MVAPGYSPGQTLILFQWGCDMYIPNIPPVDGPLATYIHEEFLRISEEIGLIREGRGLTPLGLAPKKPREGMIVVADGTNWNPGAGLGAYEFRSGGWVKL